MANYEFTSFSYTKTSTDGAPIQTPSSVKHTNYLTLSQGLGIQSFNGIKHPRKARLCYV